VNKFRAIFVDSLHEIIDRKVFYLYWAVALILVLVIVLLPNFRINGTDLFESGMMPPEVIGQGIARFFDGFFGFMIFLMVFGSAGLMPSFLSKGRIELTLSKPIDRYRLLLMKFASVFIIMCLILACTMTLVWGVLSLRISSTSWYFFLGLLFSFLQFFTIYSIVFIIGVTTNSGAAAIMGYFIIRIGTDLLSGREVVYQFLGDSIWKTILDTAYHIFPKIGELANNYVPLMLGEGFVNDYAVYSTVGIALVLILITLLVFSRRDY